MFFLLYGRKLEQANRDIFFHIFTSENMENTSVLVYGKTPITYVPELFCNLNG